MKPLVIGAKPWLQMFTVAMCVTVFLGLTLGRGCVAWMGAPRVMAPPEKCHPLVDRGGPFFSTKCPPGTAVSV